MSNLLVPKFALAIDWETSGYSYPNFAEKHQGVAFGAIIFDIHTLDPVEEIYVEIKYDSKYVWDSGAERVHGLSRSYLEKNGISQPEAALELGNLILKYFGTEDQPMILAHRAYFDIAFTTQLMKTIDVDIQFHPTPIDTSVFGTILMETSKSDTIFQTLGIIHRAKEHNALEDIRITLLALKKMKELFIAGVISELSS